MMMHQSLMIPAKNDAAVRLPVFGDRTPKAADNGSALIRPARSFRECLEKERKTEINARTDVSRASDEEAKTRRREEASASAVKKDNSVRDPAGDRKTAEQPGSSEKTNRLDGAGSQRCEEQAGPAGKTEKAHKADKAGKGSKVLHRTDGSAPAKELLIERIVAMAVQSPSAAVRNPGETPVSARSLTEELKKFDAEGLKDLLDKMQQSARPLETLKDWMAAARSRLASGGKSSETGGKVLNGFRDAFAQDPDHDSRMFVNKNRVKVFDKRSEQSGRESSMGKQSAETRAAESVQKQSVSLQAEAVRKEPSGAKSFDQYLLREQNNRPAHQLESKQQTLELNRTNQTFNDLVRQAKLMLEDKKSVMQFELRPEHLGKVTLKIEMSNDRISASLMAHNDQAGDMLKQNMGDLYKAFREAGFDTTRLDVNVGSGEPGMSEGGDRSAEPEPQTIETTEPRAVPNAFAFEADAGGSSLRIDALV